MTADEYYLDALGVLTQDWPKIKEKFDSMEAEIKRLRAALSEIDRVAVSHERGSIGIAQRIARDALHASD